MAQNNVAGARFCTDAICGVNVLSIFSLFRRFFSRFSLQILIQPGSKTSIETKDDVAFSLNIVIYLYIYLLDPVTVQHQKITMTHL